MAQKVIEGLTSGEMADLAEFEALRHEIGDRLKISYTIITLDLAAVGSGLAIVDTTSHVLAGLALISTLLWLLWADNSAMIQRLGAYVAIRLAPRLREVGRPALEWESFMRELLAGGTQASMALFGDDTHVAMPTIRRKVSTDWYITTILGAAPPVLLGFYLAANLDENGLTWVVVGTMAILAVALWVYALFHFVAATRVMRAYGNAVVAMEQSRIAQHNQATGTGGDHEEPQL